MKYLAVFVSGTGTNLQAIIDAIESGRLQDTRISVVVCNKKAAQGLERAKQHNIPTIYLPYLPYRQQGLSREDYDRDLTARLGDFPVDLVVLAGWMRIFSLEFLRRYPHVLNIHPALPGTFPGMHAIAEAYEAYQRGEIAETGVMVHWAPDEAVDSGPVVMSQPVAIYPSDTLETLEARVHNVEHDLYVRAIAHVLDVELRETVD
jgi:formyltetrahydrofolate-dependent phosphoribosylglycinamide formyltransferase